MAIFYGIEDSVRRFLKMPQNKDGPLYRGARGELKVHKKLSELDNNYYVFCGIRITTKYRKKAQMDFVVVSKKGVVVIEIKNWSDKYLAEHKKYGLANPYLQVDRAGLVMYVTLRDRPFLIEKPPVHRVLLAVQENMQHDPEYKFVDVKNLNNIISYIQTRYERLSDEEVKKIVYWLEVYAPQQG